MNFSFSSDQQLLKNSARAFLDEHMKPATVRLLWDDPRGESEALWKEMGELGWLGLSLPEAHGGSGSSPGPMSPTCSSCPRGRPPGSRSFSWTRQPRGSPSSRRR